MMGTLSSLKLLSKLSDRLIFRFYFVDSASKFPSRSAMSLAPKGLIPLPVLATDLLSDDLL